MTEKPCESENLLWQRHYVLRGTAKQIRTVASYLIKVLHLPSGKEVLVLTTVNATDPEFQEQQNMYSIVPRMLSDVIKFKSENEHLAPMYVVGTFMSPIT